MTTRARIEQQIQYHDERAMYLTAHPYLHVNVDEEEHRAEAKRLRALLPAVAAVEQSAETDAVWADQQARIERVKQRRARWGC